MSKILNRITKTMEEKGITQRELTKQLNMGETNFGAWKNGKSASYKKYLPKIAEILGVTVDYLANGTETEYDEFLALYRNAPDDIREAIVTILKRCTKK